MAGLSAAALVGPVALVHADAPAVGTDCGSGQIGDTATAPDGGTLRCMADESGQIHWLPDTHAVTTIADLQRAGYSVTVDRTGDHPLPDCAVVAVHNPMTVTSLNSGGTTPGGSGTIGNKHQTTITVSKTIDVTLDCAAQ
ncbi:hypothetical protein A5784_13680 [Mycobacterium sp. 852013-50091_SCH5140682]|nr:hypothetical protein A5784_13680 [Mycobacterium sp. 852013-50091_SCH5140682]